MSGDNSMYPLEWRDDETMDVLFSPFRENREINPQSWDTRMKFWIQLIRQQCINNHNFILNTRTLPQRFVRNGKVPACLETVVTEMKRLGHLQKLSDFNSSLTSSWFGWGYDLLVKKPVSWTYTSLVKQPLMWTWGKVIGEEVKSNNSSEDYVIPDLAQQMADAILEVHRSNVKNELTDAVIEYTQLQDLCKHLCPDPSSFHLSILLLARHKRCSLLESSGPEKLIKFAQRDKITTTAPTENDLRIYKLKVSQEKLTKEIEELYPQISLCVTHAKEYLAKGQKLSAKNCLRHKRRLEQIRIRKEAALDNLLHMQNMIEQVDSHKMIYDAYKSGNDAFKDLTQRYGLTPEMVDDAMVQVQEMNETVEDMNQSISQPLDPNDPSMDELESELADIIAEDTRMDNIELPKPPTGIPVTPPHQELIDSLCQLKITPPELHDLPEAPTFDPGSSPFGSRSPQSTPAYTRQNHPAMAQPQF